MRGRARFACVGLAMLAGGCARDNPLFGLDRLGTEGNATGNDEEGSVTAGRDATSGGGATEPDTTGGGSAGGSTAAAVDTGVDTGIATGQPVGDTTHGDTEGDATTTPGIDPKDLVLFQGPTVLGDFCAGAAVDNTFGSAVDACVEHVEVNGMPCMLGAAIFPLLRAEPFPTLELDAFPVATDRRVVGPNGDVIADSIQALFSKELLVSLASAEVIEVPFWTGGFDNSAGTNADCGDWHEVAASGWAGNPALTSSVWFEATDLECAEPRPILCACAE